MSDCLFCKFGSHEVAKEFILETDRLMVFPDIHPVAPVHLLIVPKKHIKEFSQLAKFDQNIWEEMVETLHKLIKKYKLTERGHRIVINGGGAQLIDHFHIHLIGEINAERKL